MTTDKSRPLGWGMFVLQLLIVAFTYFAASLPIALIFGERTAGGEMTIDSTGAALSVAASMVGGLLAAWLLLRREGVVGEAWNLRRPENGWLGTIGVAVLATIAIIVWFTAGSMLVQAIGLSTPDVGEVLGWVTQSQFHFILWIVLVAIFAAGIGEELLYRGFLMDRMERLPGLAGNAALIIAIQGILFGLPHAYQGWGGVIITGVVGLFFGWLRYMRKGNLWALILAHIAVDTIMMSLSYATKLGLVPAT